MPNGDGSNTEKWSEWKGRINAQVESLMQDTRDIFSALGKVRADIAYLQGKAVLFGAGAGTIVAAVIMLVKWAMDKGG